jgi:DNA primase
MAKIPETVIQEILDKTNFLSIYQEKLRLVKKGGKWWGLCPFHAEKTSSFSVDGERGLFYCFGCQKGGSVIDFLMETDKLSFQEAMGELAEKAQVPLRLEQGGAPDSGADNERAQLLELYERLANSFHWLLRNSPAGSVALSTLRRRGISDELIDSFRLGYAPADIDWLFRFLGTKGYSDEFLSHSGLFSARNKRYPLFSDRIIFPITDQKGRVIAFGGRLLSGDGPKYINSPDTPIFRKQENLFALNKALEGMKAQDTALVCEGYMDALSFHAAGVSFAVAPLGTAFTSKQAHILKRRVSKVLLCFDSDDAGQKATIKACPIAAEAGLETSVISMAEGKDASEILEKFGVEALKKVPECSINSGDFLIRRAELMYDLSSIEGKARAAAFFYPYLDALDSEIKRTAFLEIISQRLGISSTSMQADYRKARVVDRRFEEANGGTGVRTPVSTVSRTADLFFMAALVMNPQVFERVRSSIDPDDLDDTRARDLFLALEEAASRGSKDSAFILSLCNDDSARRFALSTGASGELDIGVDKVIADGIRNMKVRNLEKARARVTREIGNLQGQPQPSQGETMRDLMKKKMDLDVEIARVKGEIDE